jgi:4-hydroxythreonine-4-phosphate dehydrogenase
MIPRLAITPGEPGGIGPELVARLAQDSWPAELVAICDPNLLERAAITLGVRCPSRAFDPAQAPRAHEPGQLAVLAVPLRAPSTPGRLEMRNGAYVVDTLQRAADGARDGVFSALVTGPVHKAVINDAGIAFTGHTEFLAAHAGVDVVMMLAAPNLRVALATTHLALAEVPRALTRELLERTLRIVEQSLRLRFGLARPRLAVLGLNPHAGEGGHFGREEIEVIEPVLADLRDEGFVLDGPLAADTAFVPARRERYDAYVAMYHDQGLPVLKALGFGDAINVTLGLPYVRTSVDHGVALDLAGRGEADASSLFAATRLALELCDHSRRASAPVRGEVAGWG